MSYHAVTYVPHNQTLQNVLNVWVDICFRWYPVHGLDYYRGSAEFLSVLCKCLAFSDLRYLMQIDVICENSLADGSGDELQSIIPFFPSTHLLMFLFIFFLYFLSLECHGLRIRRLSFLPILSNYFRSESFPRGDMHRMRHALIHSRPIKSHLQFTFIHGHTVSTQSRYYYHQCTMTSQSSTWKP